LVAHFSKGSYTVTGSSPTWLATERTKAASDLKAADDALAATQADLAAARDTEADLGGRVIEGYVEEWGLLHNATPPSAADVAPTGVGAGTGFWPTNPYDDTAMASGTGPGDFGYSPDPNGIDYSLQVYRGTTSPVTLDGSIPQAIKTFTTSLRDELVKVDMLYLQASLDRYAYDHLDMFPQSVSIASLNDYCFGYWPKNPWTNADMAEGNSVGNYTYTAIPAPTPVWYQVAGHLSDGTDYVVDDYWAERNLGMRERFKDLVVQADVQVLKDYVDEWQAGHGGTLPTAAQMEAGGALMSLHAWWPTSPWSGGPMIAGATIGNFQFTDHGDGTYTLTVREQPFTDPIYGGAFPEYYTAQ
ncbi:MAG TPA: hypothetical protein VK576_03045, partial [Thermoleophilia bacterium]|nr:hypothetical protein [Thermoleophilia bacterium]